MRVGSQAPHAPLLDDDSVQRIHDANRRRHLAQDRPWFRGLFTSERTYCLWGFCRLSAWKRPA